MKIRGELKFSTHWIGVIRAVDIIQIGNTKEELFINLESEVYRMTLCNKFSIIKEDDIFYLKFEDQLAFSSFIFKCLRKKERISQAKLASKLKVIRTSYSQYEEAKKEPTLGKFSDVLKALGYELEINIKKISRL